MVYAIGLESRLTTAGAVAAGGGLAEGSVRVGGGGMTQPPDPGLPSIAAETGGGYFELREPAIWPAPLRASPTSFTASTCRFAPPKLDGKMHKLEVKLKTKAA